MQKDPSVLFLENQLCFPLYAASRLTTKLYAPLLKEYDITYPQYIVMLVMWEHGSQTVNEICSRLKLETNTVTPLLKRLAEKGLLERKRSTEDERVVNISLTKKGEDLKLEAITIPERIISSFNGESIKESEIQAFQKTLWKLVKILDSKLNEE